MYLFSDRTHGVLLLLFLFAVGSNLFNYHLYIPIVFALFLIDWRTITQKSVLLVLLFIAALYVTWVILVPEVLHSYDLFMQVFPYGVIILLMYLLGSSIRTKVHQSMIVSDRLLFYLLFAFAIVYTLCILWSYLTITQDHPLTWAGMFVCFENEYHRIGINGGRLISTIIAYYLALASFLFPLIILYYRKLREQGFSVLELVSLVLLSLFALYVSGLMVRRTVFVLFALVFLFLLSMRLAHFKPSLQWLKKFLFAIGLLSLLGYGVFKWQGMQKPVISESYVIATTDTIIPIIKKSSSFLEKIDLPLFERFKQKGLHDVRFSWWGKGLQIILDHPFGGGNAVYITPVSKLVHNTWLDIGKDFGLPVFILFILVTLLHLYYLIYIFFSKNVERLLKYQVTIIGIGVFAIMMIEPVFNADKIFFASIFFYFGVLSVLFSAASKHR